MLASAPVTAVAGTLVPGATYRAGESVEIRMRRRGRRIDLDDGGRAVELAGRPDGWLEVAEHVVAAEGFNVNRAGVVFVPLHEGRDVDALAGRLAECSVAVYAALLDLED